MSERAEALIGEIRKQNKHLRSELFLILANLIRFLDEPAQYSKFCKNLSAGFVLDIVRELPIFVLRETSLSRILDSMITLILGVCSKLRPESVPSLIFEEHSKLLIKVLNFLYALPSEVTVVQADLHTSAVSIFHQKQIDALEEEVENSRAAFRSRIFMH